MVCTNTIKVLLQGSPTIYPIWLQWDCITLTAAWCRGGRHSGFGVHKRNSGCQDSHPSDVIWSPSWLLAPQSIELPCGTCNTNGVPAIVLRIQKEASAQPAKSWWWLGRAKGGRYTGWNSRFLIRLKLKMC